MHLHRSGIGVALIGAVAVIGLCSIALPALAADRDVDGESRSVTALGAVGTAPSLTTKQADGSETATFTRSPQGLTTPGAVSLPSHSEGGIASARGGGVVTCSVDKEIEAPGGVACPNLDTEVARCFDGGTFFPVDTLVVSLDIGVEVATQVGGDPIVFTATLYSIDACGDFLPDADLTALGSASITLVGDGSEAFTIQNIPFCDGILVSAGTTVVAEVAWNGEGQGNTVFPGANDNGQTCPSYIASDTCGLPDLTDLALIDFPNSHTILNLNVDGEPEPCPFCEGDDDCDDGDACTIDSCNVDTGECSNDEIVCPKGEVCVDGGCVPAGDDNDLCENATPISNGDVVFDSTAGADSDGSASCGLSEGSPDVWYAFTAECDGTAHAETCGSTYDTVLSVHEACPGEIANEIVCNDDFCGLQSGVDWAITAGTTYLIRVSGFNGGSGDFTLTVDKECDGGGEGPVDCLPGDEPKNDNCEDVAVDDLLTQECLVYTGDTTCATLSCGALGVAADTWHAFNLLETQDVSMGHCGTDPVFGNAFIVIDPECPCSGAFVFASASDQVTCDDGNWTMHYDALLAGDYWTPILADAAFGNPEQAYTWTICAEGCVDDAGCDDGDACTDDVCEGAQCVSTEIDCDDGDQCTDDFCGPPAEGSDCCFDHGTPGCDDPECEALVCAADSFCCDIGWDQICADLAAGLCEFCAGECQNVDNGDCCPTPALCDGDVNGDAVVNPLDSGAILARFGLDPCTEENCQYDVNCDGAIDPLDSGYVLARFGVCNPVPVCKFEESCPSDNVFNDNCEDAPVDTLNIGETLSYEADNTGATLTCGALGALGETWHAFDLTADADVTTDKCGTEPVWGNAFIVLDPECPCSGVFVFATAFDQVTCADGNWAVHYDCLPAGDYWAPEILDPPFGNEGKYLFNISAAEPASPPDNDLCGDAIPISEGDVVEGNSCACPAGSDGSASCGLAEDSPDVWYAFTAASDGTVHAETCGTVYDTVLSVHEGCPGDIANEIVCNDDFCGLQSGVDWAVTAGTTYLIRVSGFAGQCGDFTLSLGEGAGAPENDDCADALVLLDGLTAFSTVGAITDGPALTGDCIKFGDDQVNQDIWYTYAATCTGTVSVSTCNDGDPGTGDTDYDSKMAAYLGTGCPADNADIVGCQDDTVGCDGFSTVMTFDATSGTDYLVRIGGFSPADEGSGNLNVSCD